MRNFLIKLSSIALLLLAAAEVAHADVLVKNKDSRTRQLSISHKIGRTSTEIPGNGMLIISGSEEAIAVQLEDKDGNPIGKRVDITDGDRVTLKSGAITRTQSLGSDPN